MDDVFIDLDEPADAPPTAGRSLMAPLRRLAARPWEQPAAPRLGRATPLTRAALLVVLGLAAALPQGAPSASTLARGVPLPSYCTGTPIPGGRLNLLRGRNFVIFDATTNSIVNEGRCPLHNAGN